MKAGAGKSKGGAFERDTARRLSLWLSNGDSGDLLWRSSMSGGRATLHYKQGKINLTQGGDLTAIGQLAYDFCSKYFVECKHMKDLSIARSMINQTGLLANFWEKVEAEAKRYSKEPMLIAKQNLYPTLAIVGMKSIQPFENPIIVLNSWQAYVYLFDEVTRVRKPLTRRING